MNLYKQYNDIESYINNSSKLIEMNINNFINLLNFSSNIIEFNYILISTRTKNYYEILNDLIQKNIKYINEEEIKNYKIRLLVQKNEKEKEKEKENEKKKEKENEKKKEKENENEKEKEKKNQWTKWVNEITSAFTKENIDKFSNKYWDYFINTKYYKDNFAKLKKGGFLEKGTFESVFKKFKIDVGGETEIDKDEFKNTFNFCIDIFKKNLTDIYFPINLFPGLELGLLISPNLDLKICIKIGTCIKRSEKEKNDSFYYIGAEGGASIGLNLEFGFYCPSQKSPVKVSFSLGISGILASGKIGMKIQFFFSEENEDKYLLDLYYEILAFKFEFYIKLTLSISINIINFSYSLSYYIYRHDFNVTYSISYHLNKYYKIKTNKEIKDKCKKITEIRKAKHFENKTESCN